MKIPYHGTHSCNAFKDYYLKQAGCGLPVYAGSRHQKGHGIFSNLFRFAVPLLKKAGIGLAKHLLNTGSNILGDVSAGEPIKQAAKKRFIETGKNVLSSIGFKQSGSGKRRGKKRKSKKQIFARKRRCRSLTPDIFD